MPFEGIPIDRRTVLKRIGATATVGAGLASTTGSATATMREKTQLVNQHHDTQSVRSVFARHGEDLRAKLVDRGFITEDFEFESLPVELDSEVTGLDPTAKDARAGVTAIHEDGVTTALATLSASSATHEIALFVQPERDKAYALVEPKSGDDRVLVSESGISPTGCSYQTCGSCCDEDYSTLKTYDCDSNCENCEVVDTDCGCEDCDCDTDGSLSC